MFVELAFGKKKKESWGDIQFCFLGAKSTSRTLPAGTALLPVAWALRRGHDVKKITSACAGCLSISAARSARGQGMREAGGGPRACTAHSV